MQLVQSTAFIKPDRAQEIVVVLTHTTPFRILAFLVKIVCNLLIIIVINIHCRIDACIGSVFYHMLSPDSLHVVVCLLHMLHIPP